MIQLPDVVSFITNHWVILTGIVTMTGVIIGFLVGGKVERPSREERKEHAKDFNQIYKKFACVWIEKEYDGSLVLKIPKDPDHYRAYIMMGGIGAERPRDTDVQHLTNSDLALDHLKKSENYFT